VGPFAVIFPAAGRSTRFGHLKEKKIHADLAGRAVWLRAVHPFVNRDDVAQMIVAIAPEDRELFERCYRAHLAAMNIKVIDGGAERSETVALALDVVDPACEFVAVHDAARPCIQPEVIDAVFRAAREHGAAIPGIPVADTLRRVGPDRRAAETVSRTRLYAVQTPQAFRRDLLARAYANRSGVAGPITDCAQLVDAVGEPCHVVDGSTFNLKITTADDLRLAQAILEVMAQPQGETRSQRLV
jgi:2-C-methyl-D-erythritol 4-phosphate cytidylyltransferase